MDEMEKTGAEGTWHKGPDYMLTRIDVENEQTIWIRRREDSTDYAEVMTANPQAIAILTGIAKEYGDAVNVLTEEGEEHFHAIVDKSVVIEYRPADGTLAFYIEQYGAAE